MVRSCGDSFRPAAEAATRSQSRPVRPAGELLPAARRGDHRGHPPVVRLGGQLVDAARRRRPGRDQHGAGPRVPQRAVVVARRPGPAGCRRGPPPAPGRRRRRPAPTAVGPSRGPTGSQQPEPARGQPAGVHRPAPARARRRARPGSSTRAPSWVNAAGSRPCPGSLVVGHVGGERPRPGQPAQQRPRQRRRRRPARVGEPALAAAGAGTVRAALPWPSPTVGREGSPPKAS